MQAGYVVVFGDYADDHSHYVFNKLSGECTAVRDNGTNYIMGMYIVLKPDAGSARPVP